MPKCWAASLPHLIDPASLIPGYADLPGSKKVIDGMAVIIRGHIDYHNWTAWSQDMKPFWGPGFTYDFVYPYGKTNGLWDWYKGEHLHYNEAFPYFKSTNYLFLGEGNSLASLQSYHTVRWNGTFAGVPAPKHHPLIKIKDLDFYIFKDKLIHYNWCMVDVVAIMQQGGYDILPPAPLPNGINYFPPRAMDGIPSPDSQFAKKEDAEKARKAFMQMLKEDFVEKSSAARWWADDMMWQGPAGIGDAKNSEEYVRHFLTPLHSAFPDAKMEIGSMDCEGNYCGALFYIVGKHTGAWLGQSATGRLVRLKLGMHARIDLSLDVKGCGQCGQMADAWVQLDIPEAFSQMGVDLLARAAAQAAKQTMQQQAVESGKLDEGSEMLAAAPSMDAESMPITSAGVAALICCLLGVVFASVICWTLLFGGCRNVRQPILLA
jgi:predicted ester cyclase